jgi:hypothetical protein
MGESKKSYSPRIYGGNVSQYIIVQHRIEKDKDGVPKITEAILTHPDTKKNAMYRLVKWKGALELENIRIREATSDDYKHLYKRKRKKKD